jgi:acyl-CoA thioesterase
MVDGVGVQEVSQTLAAHVLRLNSSKTAHSTHSSFIDGMLAVFTLLQRTRLM